MAAGRGGGAAFDRELAALAKALGHPARVAIVRRLAADGTCVCGRIVDVLPLAQATVSQHLKVLKQAGLIRGEVDGPRTCYCVDPAAVARFCELAAKLGTETGPRRRGAARARPGGGAS